MSNRPINLNTQILNERYHVIRELGRGAQGQTLLANDIQTDKLVALKVLDFGYIDSLKALDLFERETRILKNLSHNAIPAYLDTFHVPNPDGRITRYYLVQEFIDGETLAQKVAAGTFFTLATIQRYLREALAILSHLHTHDPPIVHRDLKPSNIMVRNHDERIALIDFGAVQQTVISASGSSTIVGTFGYMAPEQLAGRSIPASDLYALGCTAIYLLSHKHPTEIPAKNMTLDYRPYVNIHDDFATFIDLLISPFSEERFSSAEEALNYLDNPQQLPQSHHTLSNAVPLLEHEKLSFTWPEKDKAAAFHELQQHTKEQLGEERFNQLKRELEAQTREKKERSARKLSEAERKMQHQIDTQKRVLEREAQFQKQQQQQRQVQQKKKRAEEAAEEEAEKRRTQRQNERIQQQSEHANELETIRAETFRIQREAKLKAHQANLRLQELQQQAAERLKRDQEAGITTTTTEITSRYPVPPQLKFKITTYNNHFKARFPDFPNAALNIKKGLLTFKLYRDPDTHRTGNVDNHTSIQVIETIRTPKNDALPHQTDHYSATILFAPTQFGNPATTNAYGSFYAPGSNSKEDTFYLAGEVWAFLNQNEAGTTTTTSRT